MEDLHLPLGAVADVEAQGVVVAGHRRPRRPGLGRGAQVADVVLELVEQGVAAGGVEQVDPLPRQGLEEVAVAAGFVVLVQQADVVAPLLAPGGQQGMGVGVQIGLVQLRRHAGAAGVAAGGGAQEVAVGDDVGPVVLAGVVDAEQHLAHPRHPLQRLQRLLGQGGDPEDHHPARQPGRALRQPGGGLAEAGVDGRAAGGRRLRREVGEQGAPQRRLPGLVRRHGAALAAGVRDLVAALGPGGQPVGAVDLVLVQEVGQAAGQLVAFAAVGVVGEEAGQGGEGRLPGQVRQEPHEAPGQRLLVEGRGSGYRLRPQHGPVGGPEEARGELDVQGGGDAQPRLRIVRVPRQGQAQPLGDAVGLDQEGLVLQRPEGVAAQPLHGQIPQGLHAVAVDDHEAGAEGRGRFHGAALALP